MNRSEKPLLCLLLLSMVLLLQLRTNAQVPKNWPPELSERATVTEIVNWLNKTSFEQARVGIRTTSIPGNLDSDYQPPVGMMPQDAMPALSLSYSSGFKLTNIEGCNLTLRNNDAKLIEHSKLINEKPDQPYDIELNIPLFRLSYKKGRAPHAYSTNGEKVHSMQLWITEFKSNRSGEEVALTVYSADGTKLRVWKGEALTFTFVDKETSERFDAAFRRAIRLCQFRPPQMQRP